MEQSELKEILELHKKWLNGEDGGIRADLRNANLRNADLSYADLSDADLRGADLSRANLNSADLSYANLRNTDLSYADLRGANLRNAYLSDADLRGADLSRANLRNADLSAFSIVPEEGSFVGWKKVKDGSVLKLLIPEDAKRVSSLVGRKCRASHVIVLEGKGNSIYDGTRYEAGVTVFADSFDDDIRVECTNGIHFFITKKEAKEY